MDITAVIPVREGSTRVKNKNIRKFAESSLLEIKIEQLLRIDNISKVLVSSDSDAMLEIARRCGADAVKRPKEYCDEKSKSFNEVVEYIAKEEVKTDTTMWIPCVCPLLFDSTIIKGIETFKEIQSGKLDYDSVATALLLKEYVFDEKGPINFSVDNHVPSQKLPNWHTIQNGFFIAKTVDMQNWKFVYGKNPYLIEMSKLEGIDIDEVFQFEMAEYLYEKYKEELR